MRGFQTSGNGCAQKCRTASCALLRTAMHRHFPCTRDDARIVFYGKHPGDAVQGTQPCVLPLRRTVCISGEIVGAGMTARRVRSTLENAIIIAVIT